MNLFLQLVFLVILQVGVKRYVQEYKITALTELKYYNTHSIVRFNVNQLNYLAKKRKKLPDIDKKGSNKKHA